jgi:hypothetical protein
MNDLRRDLPSDTSSTAPLYFSVSGLKLVLMSTCTFGLYEIYWFWQNWLHVQRRERSGIMPSWRAVFAILYCYALLRRIRETAQMHGVATGVWPGVMTLAWIVLNIASGSPGPGGLVSFLAVFILLPVQITVNAINRAVDPNFVANSRFSGWNITALIIGGALVLLTVIVSFMPD